MNEQTKNDFDLSEERKNEPILPEGWSENFDFFDESTWGGSQQEKDGELDIFDEPDPFSAFDTPEGDPMDDPAPGQQPSTTGVEGHPDPVGAPGKPGDPVGPAPTTEPVPVEILEPTPAPKKLRFRARYDHEDKDVEMDEADLPGTWQRAQVTERAQAKAAAAEERLSRMEPTLTRLEHIAKVNGYNTVEEMLTEQEAHDRAKKVEELVAAGTPQDWAEYQVDQRFGFTQPTQTDVPVVPPAAEQPSSPPPAHGRNLYAEVMQLWDKHPELVGKELPTEVIKAAGNGTNLSDAYGQYQTQKAKEAEAQARAEAAKLQAENQIYRQNENAAQRAPVRSVTEGGGTNTKPRNLYEEGFDSYGRW